MVTAKEIHSDFNSAGERLLKEAKEILEKPAIKTAAKAERCNKLGFTSSKPSKAAEEIAIKHTTAQDLIKNIIYFKEKYPLNKFITEGEVSLLCKKYNLIVGDASKFIGDIPDKNLKEIESFRLKNEDFVEEVVDWDNNIRDMLIRGSWRSRAFNMNMDPWGRNSWSVEIEGSPLEETPSETKFQSASKKPSFKIVAPEKDFNTSGMTVRDNKLVVDDPIVLQPVKGGYLIVTAWGEEASDESVINEKMN